MLYRDTSYGGLYNFQVKGSLIQRQRSGADPGGVWIGWLATPLRRSQNHQNRQIWGQTSGNL